ncbi:AVAST type 2 anti-phage system protein Avs2 [Paenibacillus sp. SI8]|uniref:AVAST type 2 anti-phage system protein Avs2 n=1 Tax=unclassified Paenibacillus TaxID=185978 RepID=UPI003467E95A
MQQFNWRNIRSYDNSQNNAFEELVCQLAREEEINGKVAFTRVGAPDGGVEAYCKLENGDEYGWQAKYFESMGDSQWSQIEKSFRTAFLKHPKLVKYYICVPLDRQDPRIENQKWFMDKWEDNVLKWTKFALEHQRKIEFEYWGSSELLSKLTQEKNAGKRKFWFASEDFSERWFSEKLNVSIDSLGNRYTPQLNFELDISKIFDGITRDNGFKKQFDSLYNELQKKTRYAISTIKEISLEENKKQITLILSKLHHYYSSIDFNEINAICFSQIDGTCSRLGQLVSESLNQYYKLKREESDKGDNKKANDYFENSKFSSEIEYLRQSRDALEYFQEFLGSPTALLANTPVLLLKGEAGIGKSHLLADIAKQRNEEGIPVLLILGQHFTNDDNPWIQILKNQLRLDINENELLGALEAKAQSVGSRALIVIDAINEGRGRFFWKDHIKGFIRTIRKYKWLGLVLSIRSSYEEIIVPKDIIEDEIAIRVTHYGFADVEYEASKMFFDNYKIQQPSIPLLHPEFQNPLFLKIFCEGLNKSGLTVVPEGFEGISSILDFYLESINNKLSEPSRFDYAKNLNLVKKVINAIIAKKIEINSQYVAYEEASKIVSGIVKEYADNWRRFLDELINEGLFTQNIFSSDNKYVDGVYFAYERFDDHITVSFMLEKHLNKQNPKSSFKKGAVLHEYIKDEMTCYFNKGFIEALSIQLPEIINMELYEVAPFCKSHNTIVEAFVSSLLWRKTESITERVIPYINGIVIQSKSTYEMFWDTILHVSANPRHLLNGERIHSRLMKDSLAKRDAWWTPYISKHYSGHSAIKRIIDWAWSTVDRGYISDDSVKLSAVTISWFLTSPNRRLRDAATKAIVCLLQNRISVLIDVLQLFEKVNDPYVYERLFAVAYGCALRNNSKEDVFMLSKYVYDTIFAKRYIYPHILLRDYARGIVEYAVYLGMSGNVIDIKKIRPPYKSRWYKHIPTIEEIDKYKLDNHAKDFQDKYWVQNSILSSMTTEYGRGIGRYGDFGRYVFQSAVTNWEKHFDAQSLSNIATKRVFELGYNVELHGEYDRHHVKSYDRHEHMNERIGKKYQWIAFHEVLAKLSDKYPMSEFDYSRNDDETGEVEGVDLEEFLSSIDDELTESEEETDNVTQELGDHDVQLLQSKQLRRRNYKDIPYSGPWNPFVRDIDPTILITHTKENKNYFNSFFRIPENNLDKWVHDYEDIPAFKDLIYTRKDTNDFVLLSSHIKWLERNNEDDYSDRKELFIKTSALLVPNNKVQEYSKNKKVHNYSYSHHWETNYKIFTREYYWSQAYRDFRLEVESYEEVDKELKTTTLEYLWEKGYDNSIDESISYLIPSEFIVNELGLEQGREGFWFNTDRQLICYDMAVEGYNTGLLIEKKALEKILSNNQLAIIWDIYIEKVANRELHEWRIVTAKQDNDITIVNLYDEETWPLRD